jgi:nucleotide-binding universal stress UspA family protein
VRTDPLVVLPSGMDWRGLEEAAEATVRETRVSLAPDARITVETDISVARALWRVVRREHRDLLVMGASRTAEHGQVRIGKRTRQLLCGFECAVAVAPRGLHSYDGWALKRIGVGYDGGPESQAALSIAASIAIGAGAKLHARAAIDDRIRSVGWSRLATGPAIVPGVGSGATGSTGTPEWDEVVQASERSLLEELEAAVGATGANAVSEVSRGRPATALLDLAEEVDLLVIGSRRWGLFARLVLGSTGEALLHDSPCPVLVVPRPPE